MLDVITESVPESILQLEKAIAENNWSEIKRTSHKMIPNMNMMGNIFIEEEIKWIENNSEDEEHQIRIKEKWNAIKPLITSGLKELERAKLYYQKLAVTKAE